MNAGLKAGMVPNNSIKTTSRKQASSAKRRSPGKQATPGVEARPADHGTNSPGVTPEERYKMIAHRAYLRAEKRGFAPGHEVDDWLRAEAEVNQTLRGG